jgi:hypothetical protein
LAGKRDTISGYTVEEVAKACEHGWIRPRRFGRGFKVTAKGRVHTREWIRKDDDLRAHVALYTDKEDAEGMSMREKRAAQVEIALNAWRRNEKEYRESLANLREMGLDPSETSESSGSTRTEGKRESDSSFS